MGRTKGILSRFPHFYQPENVRSLFYQIIHVFGQTLDQAEADLLQVMYAHFVDTANNEGSQGLGTSQKGDLDKILTLYLENLGGTSQLKQVDRPAGAAGTVSDDLYRKRMKGLIEVLGKGASTKEGIIAIVAANLGIVGDDDKAIAARNQIHIVEFLPQPLTQVLPKSVAVGKTFTLTNPNIVETKPGKTTPDFRIQVREDWTIPLVNPRLVNLTRNESVQYQGTLKVQYQGSVKSGDVLWFFTDGTASLNGIPISILGTPPTLPLGNSDWQFEADLGFAQAKFDQAAFDFSTFDRNLLQETNVAQFDQAKYDWSTFEGAWMQIAYFDASPFDQSMFGFDTPAVDIEMSLFKLTPACFTVYIPWDIEGFTEKLDEVEDRPRNQIKYIVDKVKAAGVYAVIAYEKYFPLEVQELQDTFQCQIQRQLQETQEMAETFQIGSFQSTSMVQEMSDTLITASVFDYTRFDSLNTFSE
jgi:hypothetical protein